MTKGYALEDVIELSESEYTSSGESEHSFQWGREAREEESKIEESKMEVEEETVVAPVIAPQGSERQRYKSTKGDADKRAERNKQQAA